MKRIILAAFLSVSAICTPVSYAYSDEECKSISEVAERIMTLRQDGSSMASTLNHIEEAVIRTRDIRLKSGTFSAGEDAQISEVSRVMAMEAYSEPFWHNFEPVRANSITQFGNKWMLKCMRGEI